MMTGALLPSSSPTRLRAAAARMPQPTSGEPVNVIIATSACSTRWFATLPPQVITLSQPGGSPASSNSRAIRSAVSGVAEAGFSTTGQPAATAGAILWHTRLSGKLNGEIAATTPTGTAHDVAELADPCRAGIHGHHLAGEGSGDRRGEAQRVDRPLRLDPCGGDRLGRLGGDRAANSSRRSASSTATRSRIAARSCAGGGPARWRSRATATARSRSSVPHAGTLTRRASRRRGIGPRSPGMRARRGRRSVPGSCRSWIGLYPRAPDLTPDRPLFRPGATGPWPAKPDQSRDPPVRRSTKAAIGRMIMVPMMAPTMPPRSKMSSSPMPSSTVKIT